MPRTKEQAAEMSERLVGHGAIPKEVPTIAVEPPRSPAQMERAVKGCLLYTSDAADERSSVDLGGRRIIKKTNSHKTSI